MTTLSGEFRATKAFFYTANGLGLVGWSSEAKLSRKQIADAAVTFCSKDFATAVADSGSPEKYAWKYCFAGNYIPHLLEAYGFVETDVSSVTYSRKVSGKKPDWTLGASLYEAQMMPLHLLGSGLCPAPAPLCYKAVGTQGQQCAFPPHTHAGYFYDPADPEYINWAYRNDGVNGFGMSKYIEWHQRCYKGQFERPTAACMDEIVEQCRQQYLADPKWQAFAVGFNGHCVTSTSGKVKVYKYDGFYEGYTCQCPDGVETVVVETGVVAGDFCMTVADAAGFVASCKSNTQVQEGLKKAIAKILAVPKANVDVTCRLARRLTAETVGNTGDLVLDYKIDTPAYAIEAVSSIARSKLSLDAGSAEMTALKDSVSNSLANITVVAVTLPMAVSGGVTPMYLAPPTTTSTTIVTLQTTASPASTPASTPVSTLEPTPVATCESRSSWADRRCVKRCDQAVCGHRKCGRKCSSGCACLAAAPSSCQSKSKWAVHRCVKRCHKAVCGHKKCARKCSADCACNARRLRSDPVLI